VFDHVGGPGIVDSFRLLAAGGTLVAYGSAATKDTGGNPRPAVLKLVARLLYTVPWQIARIHDAHAEYYAVLRFSAARKVGMLIAANPSTLINLARTGDLSLGEQQQVEIIKALWRGSNVLILDEPTSMLTPEGVAELQKVLVRLKEAGQAVVFITHKLHEATSIGDRVTILKQGRVAGTLGENDLRSRTADDLQAEIVRIMFGEEAREVADLAELQEELDNVEGTARVVAAGADTVLELRGVSSPAEGSELGVEDVSLGLREGEILGVAGVDGNGQRALAEVIAGQRRVSAGDIVLYGGAVTRMNVAARQKLGLRYVTDARLGEGIVGSLPVGLNLFLKRVGERPYWRNGRIQRAVVEGRAAELVREFDVRTPFVTTRAATLSGGNIQKVLLARELSFHPKVVVFHKPTYGLDVRTTATVRDLIRKLADDGGAALVISTDLDELLEICDRIAVLSRGRLVGVVPNGPGAAEHVGELMVGGRAGLEAA